MSIRKRADRAHAAHLQGTLDLLILRTLLLGPRHGQAIARALKADSDNVLIVDHGSLYPALQRLEDREVSAAEGGAADHNRNAGFDPPPRRRRNERGRAATAGRPHG